MSVLVLQGMCIRQSENLWFHGFTLMNTWRNCCNSLGEKETQILPTFVIHKSTMCLTNHHKHGIANSRCTGANKWIHTTQKLWFSDSRVTHQQRQQHRRTKRYQQWPPWDVTGRRCDGTTLQLKWQCPAGNESLLQSAPAAEIQCCTTLTTHSPGKLSLMGKWSGFVGEIEANVKHYARRVYAVPDTNHKEGENINNAY